MFPERANIGFAQVLAPDRIRLRVWERGAGLTLACGSGACAALVNAARRGLTGRRATIIVDGGELSIEWREDGHVLMTGPVATAFNGRIDLGGLSAVTVDILTFGCRLNAYESEVMRGHAARAATTPSSSTPARSPPRPSGRRARRSAAPHRERPEARIVVTGCAAQIAPERLGGDARASPACWATTRSCGRRAGRRRRLGGVRHHAGARDRGASGDRVRRPRPRLRAGAAGLRPPLHLLHHPVRPRPEPHRCRSAPSSRRCAPWSRAGYHEIVLTGVDITCYGADLPGAPTLGPDDPPPAGAGAGTCRGCACPRSTRRRSTTICGG